MHSGDERSALYTGPFLSFLETFKPQVSIRALPEGKPLFPVEPVVEICNPLIDCQVLESYVLNILGYSILEASFAARMIIM